MKVLVVEDDFASRKLLRKYLEPYGECDIAVNGEEAIDVFQLSLVDNKPYDLICLDIMLPKIDGQEVLKKVREIESAQGIHGVKGSKIIMTTALNDPQNIMKAFKSQCEAYLTKPIDQASLIEELKNLKLI
jgi:two-component system chemotaxis response regulator CheY